MIRKKQKEIALYYLNNILKRSLSAQQKKDLMDWVEPNANDLFGREIAGEYDDEEKKSRKIPRNMKALRTILARQNIADITRRGYDKNIDAIFDVFKITSDVQAVLRYLVYVETMPVIEELDDEFSLRRRRNTHISSMIIGLTPNTIEKILSIESPLVSKGIVELDSSGDASLSDPFRRVLKSYSRHLTAEKIRQLMIGKAASASLNSDNFKYIADDYNHVRTLLANSLLKQKRGVNILLYGLPGTGKTEMCKSIARDVGAKLYMISENSDNDKSGRLTDLLLSRNLLENERNTLILFDEAEDAFSHSPFDKNNNSKLYYNRMLEQNKTPVVWITNDIRCMDSAYIRRFSYVLEVKKPDRTAKENIWKNICGKHRVKLPDSKITEFAKKYDVPPSLINTAVDAAKLIGSQDAIERTIKSIHQAAYGRVSINKDDNDKKVPFSSDLLNADVDLSVLTEKQ